MPGSADQDGSPSRVGQVMIALSRKRVVVPVVAAAALLTFAARRGDTLVAASVWAEDGVIILPGILDRGVASIFDPVGGYLNTSARLIDLAASVSATEYPLIGALLTWLFSAAVVVAVAVSPTALRYRPLAALAVVLVPGAPEVFGIPLYSFWWAGLLLLLVALWRPGAGGTGWRIAFVVVGGLSSPLVFVILPVVILSAVRRPRRRSDIAVAGTAIAVAAIQALSIVLRSGGLGGVSSLPDVRFAARFFGDYLIGAWSEEPWVLGVVAILVAGGLAALAWWAPDRPPVLAILAYLLVATIAISLARAGSTAIDPVTAGPRYFFYPFIVISWSLLVLIAAWRRTWVAALPAAAVVVATLGTAEAWSARNDDLNWAGHLASCTHFPSAAIPVQTYGAAEAAWWLTLDRETCAGWLARDPFATDEPGYPFRREPAGESAPEGLATSAVVSDSERSDPRDGPAPGTVEYPAGGDIELELRRGDAVLVSGTGDADELGIAVAGVADDYADSWLPTPGWVTLRFDEDRLPESFRVTFGSGWSVALAQEPAGEPAD